MGLVVVKIKIMPISLETDLVKIKQDVRRVLERENVKDSQFEMQPVAFGLKALIVLLAWPEEKELEEFENSLRKIRGVRSVEVVDMRRAIG